MIILLEPAAGERSVVVSIHREWVAFSGEDVEERA